MRAVIEKRDLHLFCTTHIRQDNADDRSQDGPDGCQDGADGRQDARGRDGGQRGGAQARRQERRRRGPGSAAGARRGDGDDPRGGAAAAAQDRLEPDAAALPGVRAQLPGQDDGVVRLGDGAQERHSAVRAGLLVGGQHVLLWLPGLGVADEPAAAAAAAGQVVGRQRHRLGPRAVLHGGGAQLCRRHGRALLPRRVRGGREPRLCPADEPVVHGRRAGQPRGPLVQLQRLGPDPGRLSGLRHRRRHARAPAGPRAQALAAALPRHRPLHRPRRRPLPLGHARQPAQRPLPHPPRAPPRHPAHPRQPAGRRQQALQVVPVPRGPARPRRLGLCLLQPRRRHSQRRHQQLLLPAHRLLWLLQRAVSALGHPWRRCRGRGPRRLWLPRRSSEKSSPRVHVRISHRHHRHASGHVSRQRPPRRPSRRLLPDARLADALCGPALAGGHQRGRLDQEDDGGRALPHRLLRRQHHRSPGLPRQGRAPVPPGRDHHPRLLGRLPRRFVFYLLVVPPRERPQGRHPRRPGLPQARRPGILRPHRPRESRVRIQLVVSPQNTSWYQIHS